MLVLPVDFNKVNLLKIHNRGFKIYYSEYDANSDVDDPYTAMFYPIAGFDPENISASTIAHEIICGAFKLLVPQKMNERNNFLQTLNIQKLISDQFIVIRNTRYSPGSDTTIVEYERAMYHPTDADKVDWVYGSDLLDIRNPLVIEMHKKGNFAGAVTAYVENDEVLKFDLF